MATVPPSDPILVTKLYRAPEGPDVLPRERLFRRLDEARELPLMLVRAPAGFGKSTLVRHWLDTTSTPAAWVILDEQDGSPAVFLSYLAAAVRLLFPESLQATADLLRAVVPPPATLILKTFVNELSEITTPFRLVLDNFERITNADTQALLSDLLRYPPRALRLVVITRDEPALPVAALRAYFQMFELNADDLRFTREEAAALARRVAQMELEPAALTGLMESTDGWVAAMRLVLSSMRPGSQAWERLAVQRPDPGTVVDYLGVEVFARLPPFDQDFFVRTSILHEVCAALADAVLADAPPRASADLLARYTRSSAFVTALDSHGVWHHVHPMFREFAQVQLRHRFNADEVAALHRRASDWLASAGRYDDAFRHAELGGGKAAAADFLVAHRKQLLTSSGLKRMEPWLKQLPESLAQTRLELVLALGYLAYTNGRVHDLVARRKQAEALVAELPADAPNRRELEGEAVVMRGMVAGWTGNREVVLESGWHALSLLPEEPSLPRVYAQMLIASGLQLEGQTERAFSMLYDLLQELLPQSPESASTTLHVLCLAHREYGSNAELKAMAARLAELGERHGSREWTCTAEYFLGCAQADMAEWDGALRHLRVVYDNPYQVETIYFVQAASTMALILQEAGDEAAAGELVAGARHTLLEMGNTDFLPVLKLLDVELRLRRGELTSPSDVYIERVVRAFTYMRGAYEPALTYARLLLAHGNPEDLRLADDYLQGLRAAAEKAFRRRALMETLVLQAMVFEAQGRRSDAGTTLLQAMRQLQTGGEKRLLLGDTTRAEVIVRRIPAHAIGRDERRRLLDVLGRAQSNEARASLSQRELDVLRLMDEGLSNEEISDVLVISKGTVKQHVHRIFQKLNVTNRTSALNEARRQRLLAPHP